MANTELELYKAEIKDCNCWSEEYALSIVSAIEGLQSENDRLKAENEELRKQVELALLPYA